jgi:hypothetical protein
MKSLRRHWRLLAVLILFLAGTAYAQYHTSNNAPFNNIVAIGGSDSTLVRILATDATGHLILASTPSGTIADPCQAPSIAKLSKPVNITTATTTSIVAVSGSTAVYVCGATLTIAPSATTADTATFEYGTGAACTGPVVLTGALGAGDLTTAAPPLHVTFADPGTSMTAPSGNGICILSAGTTVNIQGILQYVQQ